MSWQRRKKRNANRPTIPRPPQRPKSPTLPQDPKATRPPKPLAPPGYEFYWKDD